MANHRWTAALLLLAFAAREARADDAAPHLADTSHVAAAPHVAAGAALQPDEAAATSERVAKLIGQLGDPRYTVRRAAATELRQIGAEAFDQIHAATADSDPEVAASARYLLRQIKVRWVQNSDSATIRSLLRDFDQRSDESRLSRVEEIAKLAGGEGLAALCRIARFDRSPRVSRAAALAVIRPAERPVERTRVDPEIVERELGASTREAAIWLRQYLRQSNEPVVAAAFWQKLVDKELVLLEQNAGETSAEIVLGLLWNLAEVHRQLADQQRMVEVIDRMFGLDASASQQTSVELLSWLTEHQAWDVLDEFLAKHQPTFDDSKRPLYYAALARARQGKADLAEELAAKASQLDPGNTLESFIAAKDLEEHGQFEWAVREYRRTIDDDQVASHQGILSRVYLASLLHDHEQHGGAADVLEPLVKAVQNEGRVGQLYNELRSYYHERLALPEADSVAARFHYYRAGQYRESGDRQRERAALELAIKFDPADADVLIAMYRHPESDPKWREMVRQRVRDLARQFQQEIDEDPSEPGAYNQWAWLVSNTEGDFQKAIRYSHRSLELIPPTARDSAGASFLDTLGRCYYAAGDYENAVKYQRQAIEKIDYMQVMHRQLALFEKTLAEQGAGSE